MSKCERCNQNDARVRLDSIVNGRREQHYFCRECAEELLGGSLPTTGGSGSQPKGTEMDDWKGELHYFFRPEDDHRLDGPRAEASRFIQDSVLPAFADIAQELASYGREVRTSRSGTSATAVVRDRGRDEFTFTVQVQFLPNGVLQPVMSAEYSSHSRFGSSRESSKAQIRVKDQTVADLTKDGVARAFTKYYLNSLQNRAHQS